VVEALDAALGDSAARDAGAAFGAAVAAYLWVKLFDVLASKEVLERKLSRKVIHTTSGPFFMLTWPLFGGAPSSQLFAALVPALQAVRLFAIGSGVVANENAVRAVSREGDKKELLGGPFIYTLVLLTVTACFWRTSPGGIAALSLMCGGDGLADIVGRRLGAGNALPWNTSKSFAGSAAMFLGGFGCSLFYVWLFHACGYVEVDASAASARLALIAAVCTAAESLPVTGVLDDNISVPVLALALGVALF
jgi:dolichol kinase